MMAHRIDSRSIYRRKRKDAAEGVQSFLKSAFEVYPARSGRHA
jgi:hypothetical protein